MHRVRIGGDIKFYAATENKKAVAYVSLVEDRQKRQADGTYAESDPNWFDGTFRGGWAEALNESYRSGDAILVDADIEKHSFQKEGGDVVRSMKMYVSAFGPDAIRARVAIDRTPRAERVVQQEQRADAAADAESDLAASPSVAEFKPISPDSERQLSEILSRVTRMMNYESEVYDQVEGGGGDGIRAEAAQLEAQADQLVKPAGFTSYLDYENARDDWAQTAEGREYDAKIASISASAQQSVSPERDPRDAPTAPPRAQIETELHSRLSELVSKNRISPAAATQVMDVYHDYKTADSDALVTAVYNTATAVLPQVEANWVATVPTTLVTGHKPLSWEESERMVQSMQQHAPAFLAPAPTASPVM